MRRSLRFRRCGFIALGCLALLGCETDRPDASQYVVAVLDGKTVTAGDLDLYFRVNLLDDEAARDDEEADRLKSRLFDTFIDEHLLLSEARRLGIDVAADEIAAYLSVGTEEALENPTDGFRRREARNRLMIIKLKERVVLAREPLSEADVQAYIAENRDALQPPRRVELHTLRFASMDEAKRVHRDIRRRRMTFTEAIVAHQNDPEHDRPVTVSWDSLAEPTRDVLEKLEPGQVSAPIEMNGSGYIFRVEAWLNEGTEEELTHRAREHLAARLRRQALESTLAELRAAAELEIVPRNLPFRYEPPDS